MKQPPFHKYTPKAVGQRVKVPKFYTDESKGFYFATVLTIGEYVSQYDENGVTVRFDDKELNQYSYGNRIYPDYCLIAA